MKIEILGTGCPKCSELTDKVQRIVEEFGVNAEVVKVTDIQEIVKRGVMMTPALVIDGEVKSVGKVLSTDEIQDLLS